MPTPAVAAELGRILATWHRASYGDDDAAASFDDLEAFDLFRVDPYHRTVARRHPELAPAVGRVIDAMSTRRRALVHGDFSPKNVLVGADDLWIVHFEVAHCGDPDFDTAFMLNHLPLKAIHRPAAAAGYVRCAQAFCAAYGKSPVEYLTDEERPRARALGRALLLESPERLEVGDALRAHRQMEPPAADRGRARGGRGLRGLGGARRPDAD